MPGQGVMILPQLSQVSEKLYGIAASDNLLHTFESSVLAENQQQVV